MTIKGYVYDITHVEFVAFIIVNDLIELDQAGVLQLFHDSYLCEHVLQLTFETHAAFWLPEIFFLLS
jgi:hypothetical protein